MCPPKQSDTIDSSWHRKGTTAPATPADLLIGHIGHIGADVSDLLPDHVQLHPINGDINGGLTGKAVPPLDACLIDLRTIDSLKNTISQVNRLSCVLLLIVNNDTSTPLHYTDLTPWVELFEYRDLGSPMFEKRLRFAIARRQHNNRQYNVAVPPALVDKASHDMRQPLHALGIFINRLDDCLPAAGRKSFPDNQQARLLMGKIGETCHDLTINTNRLLDLVQLGKPDSTIFPVDVPLEGVLDRLHKRHGQAGRTMHVQNLRLSNSLLLETDAMILDRILGMIVDSGDVLNLPEQLAVSVVHDQTAVSIRLGSNDTGSLAISPPGSHSVSIQANPSADRDMLLMILRKLCSRLNITLTVPHSPAAGHGIVQLEIPRARHSGVANAPSLAHEAGQRPPVILVLDDNALVLDAMSNLLENINCVQYLAQNMAEAREIVTELDVSPDLLLVDYNLGNATTGLDVIEDLQVLLKRTLPSIVITAESSADHLRQIRSVTPNVLSKPVDSELLLNSIRQQITGKV